MLQKAKEFGCTLAGNYFWLYAAIGAVAYLCSNEVLAASSGTQAQNPVGGGLLVAWAIAYLSRRRAIGGWLLYFYIQLYLSLLLSIFFFPQVISNLNPSQWDSTLRYVLFFLSVVPVLIAQGFEVFTATILLLRRNERNLRFLRNVLATLWAASTISLGIDIVYFADAVTIVFDVFTFVFACIWTLYFLRAKRVRLVFLEKAWDYTVYSAQRAKRPRTAEEKRYLRKRAALAGTATFIAFFLLMGAAIGDKKPNADIFFIPIFYALVAIAIGWYQTNHGNRQQRPSQ